MRKVKNSYLLLSLCLSLKYEANTATCSRVTTRKTMIPFSAALHLDSQLWNAWGNPLPINTLTYEWNVSLRRYISIRILKKKSEQYRNSRFESDFLEMDVYNRSYYKAGNLETIHFVTKLNILLNNTFCLFFLKVKKN